MSAKAGSSSLKDVVVTTSTGGGREGTSQSEVEFIDKDPDASRETTAAVGLNNEVSLTKVGRSEGKGSVGVEGFGEEVTRCNRERGPGVCPAGCGLRTTICTKGYRC